MSLCKNRRRGAQNKNLHTPLYLISHYDPPPSAFNGYEFTASARPAQPADHAIARATAKIVQRTWSRRKRPRRSKKVLFACGLSSGARRLRPSIRPTFPMHCVMRSLLHWWPQQARRRLPLSGCLTLDRSRLAAADERADRPRQGSVVLREQIQMLTDTVHARGGWRAKYWRIDHERTRRYMLPSACTAAQTTRVH